MVALLSDIEVWRCVTAIPAVPIATFTCSGLSNNPASSRATRGCGIIDWVGVGDSALPIVLARPTIEPQMTETASAVVVWRRFLPVEASEATSSNTPALRQRPASGPQHP